MYSTHNEEYSEDLNTDIDKIELNFLKKYGDTTDSHLHLQSARISAMPLVVKYLPLNLLRREEEEAEMNKNLRIKTLKYIETSSPHPRLPGAGDSSEVSSIVDENMSTVTDDIKAGESATDWKNYKNSEVLKMTSVVSLKTANRCQNPYTENVLDIDQEFIVEQREVHGSLPNREWTENLHFLSDMSLWSLEDFCNAFANIFLGSFAIAVMYKLSKRDR